MRALLLTTLFAACTPYSPDLGGSPFLCGNSDPKCPDGYTCTGTDGAGHMTCVNGDTTNPTVDAKISTGFDCAETTTDIEGPNGNNDVGHAWQTPVAASKTTFPLAGVSICPAGDIDVYEVTVTAEGQNLAADVEFQELTAPLEAVILNSGGTAISSSQPNGSGKVRTVVTNLAMGSSPYFVRVKLAAGATTMQNNYKITFEMTGP